MIRLSDESQRTPAEKYEEAALELAIYKLMRQECDRLEGSLTDAESAEAARRATETMPAMLGMIDAKMRKENRRKQLAKQGLRILKVAAILILVLNMGLTVTIASSSQVRTRVIQFLVDINSSFMDIGFSTTDDEVSIPQDWPENYFPAYIPEGYSIKQCLPVKGLSIVVYENGDENSIMIEVCDTSTLSSINTEGAEITYVSINDVTAIVLLQSYGETDIIWSIGDHYFIVNTDSDYETALAVARSMKVIKNKYLE